MWSDPLLPAVRYYTNTAWPYLDEFQELNAQYKLRQKQDYDQRHCTHLLPPIPDNTEGWITSGSSPSSGGISAHASAPRSYIVDTPQGEMRRNRLHLNVVPNGDPLTNSRADTSQESSHRPVTRSVTGTAIHAPERFTY